jgi:hypothetical protein
MIKRKNLLFLVIVSTIGAVVWGFLYWKGAQEETRMTREIAPPPPDTEYQQEEPAPPALPDFSDIPDFTGETNSKL